MIQGPIFTAATKNKMYLLSLYLRQIFYWTGYLTLLNCFLKKKKPMKINLIHLSFRTKIHLLVLLNCGKSFSILYDKYYFWFCVQETNSLKFNAKKFIKKPWRLSCILLYFLFFRKMKNFCWIHFKGRSHANMLINKEPSIRSWYQPRNREKNIDISFKLSSCFSLVSGKYYQCFSK